MKTGRICQALGIKVKTLRKLENDLSSHAPNRVSMLSGLLKRVAVLAHDGQNGEGRCASDAAVILPNLTEFIDRIAPNCALNGSGAARVARLEKRLRAALEAEL